MIIDADAIFFIIILCIIYIFLLILEVPIYKEERARGGSEWQRAQGRGKASSSGNDKSERGEVATRERRGSG